MAYVCVCLHLTGNTERDLSKTQDYGLYHVVPQQPGTTGARKTMDQCQAENREEVKMGENGEEEKSAIGEREWGGTAVANRFPSLTSFPGHLLVHI